MIFFLKADNCSARRKAEWLLEWNESQEKFRISSEFASRRYSVRTWKHINHSNIKMWYGEGILTVQCSQTFDSPIVRCKFYNSSQHTMKWTNEYVHLSIIHTKDSWNNICPNVACWYLFLKCKSWPIMLISWSTNGLYHSLKNPHLV